MLTEFLSFTLWLILSGALAGLSAGMFGVGGGAVMVPVLATLFEVNGFSDTKMHCAIATSLAVIIITSSRSLSAHHGRGAVDWSFLRTCSVWVVLGAVLGIVGLRYASTGVLSVLFACFAVFASGQFFFGRPNWRLRDSLPKGPLNYALGFSLGSFSALLGIGGGTLGVTLMTLCGRPIHQAIGTASGLGVLIGLPSALAAIVLGAGVAGRPPMSFGYVNFPAFVVLAMGAVFMAPLGARLAHFLNPKILRRAFAIMLALVAIKMILDTI